MSLSSLTTLKAKGQSRAMQNFTNREEPIQTYFTALSHLRNQTKSLQVLTFYGIGGIGKTSLLRYLERETNSLVQNENPDTEISTAFVLLQSELTFPLDRLAYDREGGFGRGRKKEEVFSRG